MNRNRELCFPEWCGYGSKPVLRWSGTDSNSGRLFLGCPNYNINKRWHGLFLWADKILEEYVIACDGRISPLIDNE
ncbi:hypothetical protein Ahy_A01g002513 [Arachis hypogaea]|uniref:GRF-type domain-containing protein n=1 Tax=Arachis hypogaea TaxID=3818 RepID=A0A445EQU6_ARAHY|nr:hypothetical protein Ahy_A01g002513 [Arachis hypogaea]